LSNTPDSLTAAPTSREQLTESQRNVLDHILVRTYEVAITEALTEGQASESYVRNQFERRPRHIFYIDGSRGSGKTTLLLTAREHLQCLGSGDEFRDRLNPPRHVNDAFEAIFSQIRLPKIVSEHLIGDKLFKTPHKAPYGESRRTAFVLPVLFPSDLDHAQPVMEGLFAFMDDALAAEIKLKAIESDFQPSMEARAAAGKKLQQQLHAEVTKSWFLSKQEGIDAILRDSHDYETFLEKRGRASGQSYRRVGDWRGYINNYLNYFRAQLLAVFIDDTDVNPNVSTDILHTLRIFLDHPRIVTIIAGNLRTLRQSLIWSAFSEVGESIAALSSRDSSTALEWRRFIRRQIEEYLDKVIPRPQRRFLSLKTTPTVSGAGDVISDFPRLAPAASLDEYCRNRITACRKPFFETKLKSHRRWSENKGEIEDPGDRAKLEHLLSWWLFRHWYKSKLGPKTPRELKTLVNYTGQTESAKRLAVILFENAENYELIHRFEDGDRFVTEWLIRQDLSSEWVGNRSFNINERKIPEGTYSFDFICYRLDLGNGLPIRENVESDIPKSLLPQPSGRNLIDRPPFFPVDWQPKTTRLLDAFNHSVMPGNCMNMYDLQCLPDIAWRRKDTTDPWRPSLIYKWPDVFDLLAPRLATRAASGSKANPAAKQQQQIETYFFDVVIPMATLDVGRFVSPPRSAKNTTGYTKEDLLLWKETDQELKFFKDDRQWLDDLRRRIDYISTTETALNRAETREIYEQSVAPDLKTFIEAARTTKQFGVFEHLVQYQWLLNDVRRAWHAARIFINHIGEFIEHKAAEQNRLPDHPVKRNFFSRSDRYRVVTLVSLIDEINRLPPFNDFWEKATVDIGNHVANIAKSGEVYWRSVSPERFIRMLVPADRSNSGSSTSALPNIDEVTSGLLDKKCTSSSPFLFSNDIEGHGYARLSRVLFFLVIGIGPCLPAMIHIDIAGAFYNNVRRSETKARLKHWRDQLRNLQTFCFRYRASLERFLLRVEHLLDPEIDMNFDEYVSISAIPDWSFSSLGLEGREGMRRHSWKGIAKDLIKLLTGRDAPLQPPASDSQELRSGSSLFRDAEEYLNNAQRFLTLIEEVTLQRLAEARKAS
jgi:hypothetical protein